MRGQGVFRNIMTALSSVPAANWQRAAVGAAGNESALSLSPFMTLPAYLPGRTMTTFPYPSLPRRAPL
jgi:hypothetical protein